MPVPMMAPTPMAVSPTGPSTRRRRFSPFTSSRTIPSGVVAKSWFPIHDLSPRGFRRNDEVRSAAPRRVALPRSPPGRAVTSLARLIQLHDLDLANLDFTPRVVLLE